MTLLSQEINESKEGPLNTRIILGIEWLFTVFSLIGMLINIWIQLVWNVLGDTSAIYLPAAEGADGEDFNLDQLLITAGICGAVSTLNFLMVVLLGKGITQKNPTTCKIWVTFRSILLLALTLGFGYTLFCNHLDGMVHIGFSLILAYMLLSIVIVVNFIRHVQNEVLLKQAYARTKSLYEHMY